MVTQKAWIVRAAVLSFAMAAFGLLALSPSTAASSSGSDTTGGCCGDQSSSNNTSSNNTTTTGSGITKYNLTEYATATGRSDDASSATIGH